MRSEVILVFLLFNLWSLVWQIDTCVPNTPGAYSLLTYGAQRQTSNYHCSLPCKVDSFRMKVKKYLGLRISHYKNSTSTFQLSCLTISGDICPTPGPSGKANFQTSAGLNVLYLNARSVKASVPLDGNPLCKICKLTILQQLVFRC